MLDYKPEYINEMIECVKREVKMRERVYPRWVSAGKMTQKKADYEIDTMYHVLSFIRDYAREQDEKTINNFIENLTNIKKD